jgi:hypothetical protein
MSSAAILIMCMHARAQSSARMSWRRRAARGGGAAAEAPRSALWAACCCAQPRWGPATPLWPPTRCSLTARTPFLLLFLGFARAAAEGSACACMCHHLV